MLLHYFFQYSVLHNEYWSTTIKCDNAAVNCVTFKANWDRLRSVSAQREAAREAGSWKRGNTGTIC